MRGKRNVYLVAKESDFVSSEAFIYMLKIRNDFRHKYSTQIIRSYLKNNRIPWINPNVWDVLSKNDHGRIGRTSHSIPVRPQLIVNVVKLLIGKTSSDIAAAVKFTKF